MGQTAIVLHPQVRTLPTSRNSDALLEEACGLAEAIELKVIHSEVIKIFSPKAGTYIGRGFLDSLIKKKSWEEINAVKNDRVYITDGNQFFNRPGPRIIESLEILIEIFHNDKINFKHIDSGWIKFNSSK